MLTFLGIRRDLLAGWRHFATEW